MKQIVGLVLCVSAILVSVASDAEAQMSLQPFRGLLTGHVGAAFGGDVSKPTFTPGVSVSVQEADGWGAEIDFGYSADLDADGQVLDVATYMVNANWVQPTGTVRPFGTAGLGVIQVDGCGATCLSTAKTHDLGFNVGGGVFVSLNEAAALRGDVRYFWSSAVHPDLGRPDNFGFWRVSVGATFVWAIVQ